MQTITRYAITHVNKDGMRTITGANQRRNFCDTKDLADALLECTLKVNSRERLVDLFGDPDKLQVRPVECLIMKDGREGDATSVWFDA